MRTSTVTLVQSTALAISCALLLAPDRARARAADEEPHLVPRIFLERYEPLVTPRRVTIRKVYEKGVQLTAEMEGFRSVLYDDPAGYCTIGFGHLIRKAPCDGSEPPRFRRGLSREEAMELLRSDLGLAEHAVSALAHSGLSDGQFAALCDFAYNVGRGALARSTLLKYVNQQAWERVPTQFRRYVFANGRQLGGLVARREREIELFFEEMVMPRYVPPPDEDVSPIDIAIDTP